MLAPLGRLRRSTRFTSQFIPNRTKEQGDWFNELQRITVSGETAARIVTTSGETDVTALLPRVSVPTLVLHARDDAPVPFEAGRRMAASIPGARFVAPVQPRAPRVRVGLRPVPRAHPRHSWPASPDYA